METDFVVTHPVFNGAAVLNIDLVKYDNHRQTHAVHNTLDYWMERSSYLHAYNMFDIKVIGCDERGVSTTYKRTVGREDERDSVMILPEADQVKTSIWPGVSIRTTLLIRITNQKTNSFSLERLSIKSNT